MQNRHKRGTCPPDACTLCPRECHADRTTPAPTGFCGMGWDMRIARAAPHFWEEPCISGTRGSGTVFFVGCTEQCVYCQNRLISRAGKWSSGMPGRTVTQEELSDVFLSLQDQGVHNINLVTPTHFAAQIAEALALAKTNGLQIPVVCNTSGYEKTETLRMLEGLVDIYLTDFQHASEELSVRYTKTPDYPRVAERAIREMIRQTGPVRFLGEGDITGMPVRTCLAGNSSDKNARRFLTPSDYNNICATHAEEDDYAGSLMTRGVIVRHLVLPGHAEDACDVLRILKRLTDEYGSDAFYISLMNQYTPVLTPQDAARFPELDQHLAHEEYDSVIQEALAYGFENVFFQYGDTASESFIPAFASDESRGQVP